ncbi:glycosyltransferase [Parabacteroides sp.]|uniref:glycosyltransferase n=1 Tax=Parabacteroides sp. TaxID=1869337 RepID=UPI002579FA7A|nr:glycosyltransferase [Parabacteroides sp.]
MNRTNKYHNILQIINLAGSARNFIGGQFEYLRRHGYNMHLICTPDDLIYDYVKENHVKYKPVLLMRTLSIWNDVKSFFMICKYIKDNNIDTVIAHQAKARLLGTTAAFVMNVPNRIVFAHGVVFETLVGFKRRLIILIDKIVAAMSHKTVCVSRSVAKVRQDYHIEKSERVYILGSGTCGGIDTKNMFNPIRLDVKEQELLKSKFGIEKDDFVVGFCGRMVRDKGVKELVEGFDLVKQRLIDKKIKLFIIGDSEARDSIDKELVTYINNHVCIIHVKKIEHTEMYKYLALFNVIVLPSYREGFGMVTIEAGAMNVPAIVSKSTGCIDSIVDGKTGLYCEITPESIAKKIEFMIDNPIRTKEMGRSARELIVNKYDSSIIWPYVIDVIEA